MQQQNNFKRIGRKKWHICLSFLDFEVFQHNIEALDTSVGRNQQAGSPCSIALLFWYLTLSTSHDIFENWRALNCTIASLSHFRAFSLCCASKSASVLRALHLMAPAYVSSLGGFYVFSPWSVLSDHFCQPLPSLTGLSYFLSPSCAFSTLL